MTSNFRPLLSVSLVFALFLAGCSKPTVKRSDLTDRDGVMFFEGKPFSGTAEETYDNGVLSSRASYDDGKIDGLVEKWGYNGELLGRANFTDGEPDGLAETWHDNGAMSSRANFEDGEPEGTIETWQVDGSPVSRQVWKDGNCIDGDC